MDRFEGTNTNVLSVDVNFVSETWQTLRLFLTVGRTTALCLNSCHTESEGNVDMFVIAQFISLGKYKCL